MARMSIDDKFPRDPRVIKLGRRVGWSRRETMGALIDVFQIVYDRERDTVPAEDIDIAAEREGFAAAMVECDLAESVRAGVRIKGAAERINYLKHNAEAGRLGGIKSGESRRNRREAKRSSASGEPEALGNPPDPVPDPAPDPVPDPAPDPVPEDQNPSLPRAILGTPEPAPPTTPPPGPSVPAVSPPAPVREDMARTQAAATPATGSPDPKLDEIVKSAPGVVHSGHSPTTTGVDETGQAGARVVHRDPEPSNAIQPPAPILPGSIARADARRRMIGEAWQLGGDAFRELGRDGIEPGAFDPWAGMPGADDEGMKLLIAHVDRLLTGEPPDVERARAVFQRRIAVAKAEGRAADPPTRRWITPMRLWNPESFAKGAEMSPEQVRPRSTHKGAPAPAPPKPRKPAPPPPPDPPLTDEDRAAIAALANNLAADPERAAQRMDSMSTAELVKRFGDSARAPPPSTGPNDDAPNPKPRKAQTA